MQQSNLFCSSSNSSMGCLAFHLRDMTGPSKSTHRCMKLTQDGFTRKKSTTVQICWWCNFSLSRSQLDANNSFIQCKKEDGCAPTVSVNATPSHSSSDKWQQHSSHHSWCYELIDHCVCLRRTVPTEVNHQL